MNISTQTLFLVFFTLAASLVLTLLINRVRRWRQRQRDEAQIREAEYEDAIRQSQAELQRPTKDAAASTIAGPSVAAVESSASVGISTGASTETAEPKLPSKETTATGAEVLQADRFMAWSPPEAEVWQPPANQAYEVSWAGQ
jgi:hypothetical protein